MRCAFARRLEGWRRRLDEKVGCHIFEISENIHYCTLVSRVRGFYCTVLYARHTMPQLGPKGPATTTRPPMSPSRAFGRCITVPFASPSQTCLPLRPPFLPLPSRTYAPRTPPPLLTSPSHRRKPVVSRSPLQVDKCTLSQHRRPQRRTNLRATFLRRTSSAPRAWNTHFKLGTSSMGLTTGPPVFCSCNSLVTLQAAARNAIPPVTSLLRYRTARPH